MKYLITGANGQLGYDVKKQLTKRGFEAIGTDVSDMDITDATAVNEKFDAVNPDVVIHCAAWTAVDAAEDDENKSKVYAVNVIGTKNIANACKNHNCKMVYISTDYVFSAVGDEPIKPDCKEFAPLNYYGETKYLGEKAVSETMDKFFIVRIAWVFGKNGNNFIKTMLKLSENHTELHVVNDQIGTPTYTYDLARLLIDISESNKYGFYHATNEGGYISWCDFAKEIFALTKKNVKVIPVTTEEYGLSKARRPLNSRLDKSKLKENGFAPLPDWQDALKRYIGEMNYNGTN
ncbi:dTDP-4-dehydrorhamnose reductase [uncultured Eubacterium sp.]|uniref:dTDP-4-dehydrorhamnose reductase n=1 Tax=uncultured Eubacterium sp. TaxID=165185 RepID=UPI0025FD420E|nr:dTDP-4-dehydrorhamnose reductase [uncultured Eubacterium sp.]